MEVEELIFNTASDVIFINCKIKLEFDLKGKKNTDSSLYHPEYVTI